MVLLVASPSLDSRTTRKLNGFVIGQMDHGSPEVKADPESKWIGLKMSVKATLCSLSLAGLVLTAFCLHPQARDGQPPASKRIKLDRTDDKSMRNGKQSTDSRFQDFLAVMAPSRSATHHDQPTVPSETTAVNDTPSIESVAPPQPDFDPLPAPSPQESFAPTTEETDGAADDDTLTDAEYFVKRMKRSVGQAEVEVEMDETGDVPESKSEDADQVRTQRIFLCL